MRQVDATGRKTKAVYIVAVLAVTVATVGLRLLGSHVNSTTVALVFLLIVLFVAARWGSRPAIAASIASLLCFNFFFIPPTGTLSIADPENWVALAAFLIIAITAGQLSANARRRTEEAEEGRREIERLYTELQTAFERASHAEALRQSERMKSALLDAITHDIRTPLTSIKASVTTLLDEMRTDENVSLDAEGRREMLEVINEEADRLNRFIESMVELARMEAGEIRLRRRWGAVEEIIQAALERARPLLQNHTVKVSLDKNIPAVRVDGRAVTEALYTLIDNAAKYTPPDTLIRITASCDGDAVRVSVEDEGAGIPVEIRERVFEKFFRASADIGPVSTRASGIGMGLAIARGITEAHGGRIWIEDVTGDYGARFVFTLPVGSDDEDDEDNSTERESADVLVKR
jgi:two-component system sensor histidine kinase KdpD